VRCRPVRDRGAADALGLVLIAPAVIGLALLVVSLGRSVESRSSTQAAAEAAAQAAALERSPGAARTAANRVVATMLEPDVDTCASPQVAVDTGDFRAGGSVAVTVTCSATNRGVEVVQDGPRTFSVRATARIDPFRATEGP
jgi:Flp pilus assembly protein TadG